MRVFITGVSSGIGKELTQQLALDGHEVWGIARRTEPMETLAADLPSQNFRYDCCDLADREACAALRKKMAAEHYVPDAIILNAAIDLEDSPGELGIDQSSDTMRINYDGAHFWVAAFIQDFVQRGHGQFIAVSSIFAQWPDPAAVSYSASKSALSMLFRGLRIRYTGSGLLFKLLYLGPVDTPINPRFSEQESSSSMVVASAPKTAQYMRRMLESKRENFYFPLYILIVFTFLRWLPDKLFQALTNPFKR